MTETKTKLKRCPCCGGMAAVRQEQKPMEFSDVTDYGVAEDGIWYVERFGKHDIWFNPTEILLIGRKFDVENTPPRGPWV